MASLRNAQQIVEIAELGHAYFTISPRVAEDLFKNDLTADAVAIFEKSASGDVS